MTKGWHRESIRHSIAARKGKNRFFRKGPYGSYLYGERVRHSIAAKKGKGFHYTARYKRERIRKPSLFQKSSFRTIDPGRPGHTKLIIGRLKGKKTTTTQAILRERENVMPAFRNVGGILWAKDVAGNWHKVGGSRLLKAYPKIMRRFDEKNE